jgi:hypothetical protein
MKLNRCPVCHGHIHLDAMAQDECQAELVAILQRLSASEGAALTSYLGLFRSANRDLAHDRALKLTKEILELETLQWLLPALQETVESLRAKRSTEGAEPLKNHKYLVKVLASVISRGVNAQPAQQSIQTQPTRPSKTMGALADLEALKHE